MSGFNDFVSTELPKRPFTSGDGTAGQMLVRSTNPLAVREMVWADAPSGTNVGGYTAAEILSGHQAIALDANGQAINASADNLAHQYVEALTTNAALIGDNVQVVMTGLFEHLGWNFTTDLPVYLGLGGAITQTVPPTALFVKVLGIAVSPTRIKVDFQPAIIL
jgi:hypothetical protein